MKKHIFTFLRISVGILGIIGAIMIMNTFLTGMKEDSYKLHVKTNEKVFEDVKSMYFEQMSVQYSNIIKNGLVDSLKDGSFINTNNNFNVTYVKGDKKITEDSGFETAPSGIYFTGKFPVKGTQDFIRFRTSLDVINDYVQNVLGKEFIFIFKESYANDLTFNNKIANYNAFLGDYLVKKNSNMEISTVVMKEFDTVSLNNLLETKFENEKVFNAFLTSTNLKDFQKNEIGYLLIADEVKREGSITNFLSALEQMSQTVLITVMVLVMSAGLILY